MLHFLLHPWNRKRFFPLLTPTVSLPPLPPVVPLPPLDTEEFSGSHALGGVLQRGILTPQQCIEECTAPCQAVDFNSLSQTCWFHAKATACTQLVSKESCTHYKKVSCGM